MTDTCENITFPQIRWRAVIKYEVHMIDNFQTYSRTFGSISDEYLCKQSNIWHHEITELHALRKQENASDSIENLRASGASLWAPDPQPCIGLLHPSDTAWWRKQFCLKVFL